MDTTPLRPTHHAAELFPPTRAAGAAGGGRGAVRCTMEPWGEGVAEPVPPCTSNSLDKTGSPSITFSSSGFFRTSSVLHHHRRHHLNHYHLHLVRAPLSSFFLIFFSWQ
ncbi:hypothetical protein E2C01_072787 [Portunus trituberculatus]|uniref:Uncharacterized protein n=1 Tax=Portunus trituberculatus TaxID=210409 RepID=A0A5B7I7L3_PORTR|nr:hypothetical protein [Portunus trituberculatus]